MRPFVSKPRASELVGVIVIESLPGLAAVDALEHDDATLDLLFDRLAREIAAGPATEAAAPVRVACCAVEPVARVTTNAGLLIRELEGTARRWQRAGARR